MNESVYVWQIAGFVATAILGTLLHFLFEWTGDRVGVALFSAVNESIWEHMKLLYYPMLLFAVVEYWAWGRGDASFWCIHLAGILLGLVLIPVLYYTYTGALGVEADWFNITIFFLAAAAAFRLETRLFEKAPVCPISPAVALLGIGLIGALFTILTFAPLSIPLFRDPVTGTYGFQRRK